MALRQGVAIEEVAARLARVGHRLALLDESRGRTIEGKADAE